MRELEDLPGFIIGGHNLDNIRYAEDTVLIADTEKILRELEDLLGFIIGGHNLNNIRYADDTVLIADTEKKVQELLQRWQTRVLGRDWA